jgi:glycine/D-amino acid oxidase-like deaminating enzyme
LTQAPWLRVESAQPEFAQPDAVPNRAEVVILGASLAGLSCAHRLAQAGVKVVVLENSPRLGECAVGRSAGLAQLGLCEHPHQLVEAIGLADAQALLSLSLHSLGLLQAHAEWVSEGELNCASMDNEEQAIVRSAAILSEMGIENRLLENPALADRLGLERFELGRVQPLGGSLNPLSLLKTLAKKAVGAGASVQLGFGTAHVSRSDSGLLIQGASGQCLGELVVFADGWRVSSVEPWFQEKVFPVRAQHYWVPGSSPLKTAGRTQHGYLSWGPSMGGVVVSGCRWGSPHMEVGETEPRLNAKISDHLAQFLKGFSVENSGSPVEWTSIMDFSCDGLPLLGPLPGQARKIACVGFGGQDLGLALACAEAVVEGILQGVTPAIPDRFYTSRFV